jgi:heme/copper-type cytochrome/quinol oxidase subunit 2
MDEKVLWLIVFVLIGVIGLALTFVIRYRNPNGIRAGYVIAGCTMFFLFLWLICGANLLIR